MKKFILLIWAIMPLICFSQDFVTDLNGFRLGQYREVTKNEYKTPFQSKKYDDGFEYDAFWVNNDSTVYTIFEYSANDLNAIWSIQVSGINTEWDCHFKGLKLGMTSNEVAKILGKPNQVVDIGEYGKRWEFQEANYSVEINSEGVLSSIKIIDKSDEFFPELDLKKIPTFAQYSRILKSRDYTSISDLLAPDIEIFKNDSTHYFNYSINHEIKDNKSKLFDLVNDLVSILNEVNTKDSIQYQENVRVVLHQDPMHVAKFQIGNHYSEIVFHWRFGKYLIWEVKL